MPQQKIDLSNGKFVISASDLIKLMCVVVAIGTSYAMASSRLTMIENGLADGRDSVAKLSARVAVLEQHAADRDAISTDVFHEYDLRIQSLEEKVFGHSVPPSVPRRPKHLLPVTPDDQDK